MNLWFGHMVTLFTGKHCTERTFHLNQLKATSESNLI